MRKNEKRPLTGVGDLLPPVADERNGMPEYVALSKDEYARLGSNTTRNVREVLRTAAGTLIAGTGTVALFSVATTMSPVVIGGIFSIAATATLLSARQKIKEWDKAAKSLMQDQRRPLGNVCDGLLPRVPEAEIPKRIEQTNYASYTTPYVASAS